MIVKKDNYYECTGDDGIDFYSLLEELDSFVHKLIELGGFDTEGINCVNPDDYQPPYFYIGMDDIVFHAPVGTWKEYRELCNKYAAQAVAELT